MLPGLGDGRRVHGYVDSYCVTETTHMSLSAKREYLAKIHGRYQRAGRPATSSSSQVLPQLRLPSSRPAALKPSRPPTAFPKAAWTEARYQPALLLPPLKAIWLLSDQLCSKLLKAALPHWLQAYEQLTGVLPAPVRTQLLTISPAAAAQTGTGPISAQGSLYHQTRHGSRSNRCKVL